MRRPALVSSALLALLLAAPVRAEEPGAEVLEHHGRWESGYGAKFYNVVGRLRNTSGHAVRWVKLRIEALDAKAEVVASTDTYNESAEALAVPDAKALAASGKVSFCLLDLARYTAETVPNAAAADVYTCDNQGISVGWADVYAAGLEGQDIPLTGVADGLYKLRSLVDPNDRLHEEPNTNNVTEITIRITGSQVTVQ